MNDFFRDDFDEYSMPVTFAVFRRQSTAASSVFTRTPSRALGFLLFSATELLEL